MSLFGWKRSPQSRRVEELESDLQKAQGRARDEREFIRAILGSMFEGVLVIGPDGKVLFANAVFARMFGSNGDKMLGKNYWELFRQQKVHALIEESLKSRRGVSGELEIVFPDEKNYQVQISPIRSGETFLGVVLILHDVSSLKRLERLRTEFVANVSHELKTPLASILGAAETLKGGAIDDTANRGIFLDMIEHHAGELKNLIDQLLELSRMESGAALIRKASLGVGDLFEDLCKTFAIKALEKRVQLAFDVPPGLEARADRAKLRQALSNLIENALNYTDSGGKVSIRASAEPGGTVFTVADTGIGISPEDRVRVFERFYRAEKSRTRDAGGTGLGLAIVKHIVESHGGRVEVESELQKGSTFRLFFPQDTIEKS